MLRFDNLIGYSTGALALSDWRSGLRISRDHNFRVIELSALRLPELQPMVDALPQVDLSDFSYVSVHLPSRYTANDESGVLRAAEKFAASGYRLVVHPDALFDCSSWRLLGKMLLIENMDKRKRCGRTPDELSEIFSTYPNAGLCFDFGHARQIDPTMSQAASILETFGSILREIHFSDVDSSSQHRLLNQSALAAFSHIRYLLPRAVPVILETLVRADEIALQIAMAEDFFAARRTAIA